MITEIKTVLQKLTSHSYIEITTRGNEAIKAAFSFLEKMSKVLIPEEGGWLTYETIPKKLGLSVDFVSCTDAKIDLRDLKEKLISQDYKALIYQNPGGYFAEQPMQEICALCQQYGCLVIVDVSGAIGTKLCDGTYADLLVGSFGKWKLVDAGVGGFISCRKKGLFEQMKPTKKLTEQEDLAKIEEALKKLKHRVSELQKIRTRIIDDLSNFEIIHKDDYGFIVVIAYSNEKIKNQIVDYCKKNNLEWTECPRYIRVNRKAISIEVKRSS